MIVEVTAVPFESVTRAVSAVMPVAVGVQLIVYGAESTVPMTVVPERKSTRLTTAPPLADALAVTVAEVPRGIEAPFVGVVIATVGTEVATVTATAVEVIAALLESVTRAVSETLPVAVGVQLTV